VPHLWYGGTDDNDFGGGGGGGGGGDGIITSTGRPTGVAAAVEVAAQ